MSLVTLEIEQVAEVVDDAITKSVSAVNGKLRGISNDVLKINGQLQEIDKRINENDEARTEFAVVSDKLTNLETDISLLKDTLTQYAKSNINLEDVKSFILEEIAKVPRPIDGKDGKDVDVESILSFIEEEIGKIPIPENGKDGISVDFEEIKSFILEEIGKIPQPADGKDGTSVNEETIFSFISEQVAKIPVPKDGKDGVSVDFDEVKLYISEEINKIPRPIDGKDGISIDEKVIFSYINDQIAKIPLPLDGKDGTSVDFDEIKSYISTVINQIPVPKDGIGLASAMIDRNGELYLTCTDGSIKSLGVVVGRDGICKDSIITSDIESIIKGIIDKQSFNIVTDIDVVSRLIDEKLSNFTIDDNVNLLVDNRFSIERDNIINGIKEIIPVVREESIPEDTAEMVAKAIAMVAESPPIQYQQQQPIVVNVTQPQIPFPTRDETPKKVTTYRDKDGNLVADITPIDKKIVIKKDKNNE